VGLLSSGLRLWHSTMWTVSLFRSFSHPSASRLRSAYCNRGVIKGARVNTRSQSTRSFPRAPYQTYCLFPAAWPVLNLLDSFQVASDCGTQLCGLCPSSEAFPTLQHLDRKST